MWDDVLEDQLRIVKSKYPMLNSNHWKGKTLIFDVLNITQKRKQLKFTESQITVTDIHDNWTSRT